MAAQQWHPAMAASNGTTSNPPTCTPTPPPIPSNGSPAMAAQQWQPATAPRPIFELVHQPPLLLEVRTPIAKAIWGKSFPRGEIDQNHVDKRILGGKGLQYEDSTSITFVQPVYTNIFCTPMICQHQGDIFCRLLAAFGAFWGLKCRDSLENCVQMADKKILRPFLL